QPTVILTQFEGEDAPFSESNSLSVIHLDNDWETIARQPESNPIVNVTADNLAYVIYTSGSTGQPKGAMLQHRGLCNLTDVQRRAFNIRAGESRILQFSPLSFDASVWETFMALRNGATLVLAHQETLTSGLDLLRLLQEERVTTVTLPPSLLAVLPETDLPDLETIIAAGEACSPELVSRWGPGRAFFNAYGPTETTVCASMFRADPADPTPPPIGQPIANFQLYVLDAHQQPVPIGVPGELCVAGVGLARGYLNRPELTAEKFVPLPVNGNRLSVNGNQLPTTEHRTPITVYRTGDLVRWRPDGNLEFLGRIDHQVKVRGFRIELGEIEAALEQHPALQMTAVLAREDSPGNKQLVAYVVPETMPGPAEGELRSFLRQTLPAYMVPAHFVTLEEMPLTPSNKIDRKALPAPDRARPDLEKSFVAPRNETEAALAAICAELLQVEKVGVYDNFFELGGHSLLATQFISRVRDSFGVEIPLRTLFETPTVADMALALEVTQKSGPQPQAPTITRVSREGRRMKRTAVNGGNGSVRTNAPVNGRVQTPVNKK
ncbi:MAG TPA: amino acid adenylation domain-containing protein, partial [Anaerolineae bacterium]|nr:amino acid adenylation domain-containing protein [Anaerolineae bacterium]